MLQNIHWEGDATLNKIKGTAILRQLSSIWVKVWRRWGQGIHTGGNAIHSTEKGQLVQGRPRGASQFPVAAETNHHKPVVYIRNWFSAWRSEVWNQATAGLLYFLGKLQGVCSRPFPASGGCQHSVTCGPTRLPPWPQCLLLLSMSLPSAPLL